MKEVDDMFKSHYLNQDSNLNNNTIQKENYNLNPNSTPTILTNNNKKENQFNNLTNNTYLKNLKKDFSFITKEVENTLSNYFSNIKTLINLLKIKLEKIIKIIKIIPTTSVLNTHHSLIHALSMKE